jgi:hypothetical protein
MRSQIITTSKWERVMGDQDRSEKDFEALAALLADIEKELESESEADKSGIKELYEHCMRELALLKKAKKKGPD